MQLPPGNWFAPPVGNRTRLFLSNEKHMFLGIFHAAAGRHRSSLGGGVDYREVYSSEPAGYFEAMIVFVVWLDRGTDG